MPAFSSNRFYQLRNELQRARNKLIGHYQYDIETDEVIDTVFPEELRFMARKGPELFNVPHLANAFSMKVNAGDKTINVSVHFRSNKVMVPRHFIDMAPESSFHDKVGKWLAYYIEWGKQYAIAQATFDELQDVCGSEQQVRFFLPAVLTLMDSEHVSPDLRELANKLRAPKTPRNIPPLEPWVREGCQVLSGIITAASMMPDEPANKSPVLLGFQSSMSFDFHGKQMVVT